jgi:hypothetical protein
VIRPMLLGLVLAALSSCIASSVVESQDRARELNLPDQEWLPGSAENLDGVFVSTQITGALAASVRKVVYLFQQSGNYTGAALVESSPPRFEVIAGEWQMQNGQLLLDGAEPAQLQVAEDGSLRITGETGQVVLRRELNQ